MWVIYGGNRSFADSGAFQVSRRTLSEEASDLLTDMLSIEYEFYDHARDLLNDKKHEYKRSRM